MGGVDSGDRSDNTQKNRHSDSNLSTFPQSRFTNRYSDLIGRKIYDEIGFLRLCNSPTPSISSPLKMSSENLPPTGRERKTPLGRIPHFRTCSWRNWGSGRPSQTGHLSQKWIFIENGRGGDLHVIGGIAWELPRGTSTAGCGTRFFPTDSNGIAIRCLLNLDWSEIESFRDLVSKFWETDVNGSFNQTWHTILICLHGELLTCT